MLAYIKSQSCFKIDFSAYIVDSVDLDSHMVFPIFIHMSSLFLAK